MYPFSFARARICGIPNMTKFTSGDSFPKLCLIVSSIGTFIYNLACFFCDLSQLLPNDYSCNDFSFVSQIKNTNFSCKFLVSYHVTSLFTNIPLQEAVDIAINLTFNHKPNLNILKKYLKNYPFLLHPVFLTHVGIWQMPT